MKLNKIFLFSAAIATTLVLNALPVTNSPASAASSHSKWFEVNYSQARASKVATAAEGRLIGAGIEEHTSATSAAAPIFFADHAREQAVLWSDVETDSYVSSNLIVTFAKDGSFAGSVENHVERDANGNAVVTRWVDGQLDSVYRVDAASVQAGLAGVNIGHGQSRSTPSSTAPLSAACWAAMAAATAASTYAEYACVTALSGGPIGWALVCGLAALTAGVLAGVANQYCYST